MREAPQPYGGGEVGRRRTFITAMEGSGSGLCFGSARLVLLRSHDVSLV